MTKAGTAVLTAILTLGIQAWATPIVVFSVKDGFVIGTNGRDTGGVEVCKLHYAGSTVVLRATSIARIPKSTGSSDMIYDPTVKEWRELDPRKNMSDIALATRQFFMRSTEVLADLEAKREVGQTKTGILENIKQDVIVAGFMNGVPTLFAYSLNYANGSFGGPVGYPMSPFQSKALWWNGGQKPPHYESFPDSTLEDVHQYVRKQLEAIRDAERDKTAFGEPWEIVHVTRDKVEWLEGHKDLCEKARREWAPK